jgi:hypothetical protein
MAEVTRAEHMQWCKKRALEYLPTDPQGAFSSMASDLGKHPETASMQNFVAMSMLMPGLISSPAEMEKWINGFAE